MSLSLTIDSPNGNPTKRVTPPTSLSGKIALSAFFIMHLLPLLSIYTGIEKRHLIYLLLHYVVGMLAIILGYHRYFSHHTFRMNRFFQFILAFLAQSTAQKGVLWWASHHRVHHKHSDTPQDLHSPRQNGFWYSHFGWFLSTKYGDTDCGLIKDFAKYPELVWLNRYHFIPPVISGVCFLVFLGPSALWFSFFLGIVLLWHGTYTINSLSHVWGRVRYNTGDDSKNNWFLAIITLGEGWHNNHHHYMHSARQGFFWYEFDIGYYILKILALLRVVKKVRKVPKNIKYTGLKRPA